MNEVAPAQAPAPRPSRRGIFIGVGVALAGLACICVVAAVIFAVLDPFGWIARLFGGGAGAATAMPPDVPLYIGVDLARARSEEVDRLIATFAEATGSTLHDLDTVIEEADDTMQAEIGMTITEDVLPWIGQYAGIGLSDLQMNEFSGLERADWVIAIEVRDRGGADAFLERLREALADEQGADFEESEYEGVTLYEFVSGSTGEGALARSGSYVLIGSSAEALRTSIDAQRGESLADTDAFRETSSRLPSDAILTAFVDVEEFAGLAQEATDTSMPVSPLWGLQAGGLTGMGASASVIDVGVRFNGSILYDPEVMTETQLEAFEAGIDPLTIDRRFPEDTFFFLATRGLSTGWRDFEDNFAEDEAYADLAESIRLLEDQIGIDLGDDLFAYLDGEIALGLGPSSEGLLPEMLEIRLGSLVLAETTQEEALRTTIEILTDQIPESEGLTVLQTTVGGVEAYQLADPFQQTTALVYGVGEGSLFIATGTDLVEAAFAGGASLADDETYRATWASFPSGQIPTFYLDLEGLLGQIREGQAGFSLDDFNDSTDFLSPIRVIGAAASLARDYTAQSTIVVFIEWLEPTQ